MTKRRMAAPVCVKAASGLLIFNPHRTAPKAVLRESVKI